ncbi:MAG: cell division protein FtsB [Proteobacteria bacterium]|nr:cell division protein FtsB [Pseudomonadota bacterium]
MKLIVALLIALVLALQYPLWMGSGSVVEAWRLKQERDTQGDENRTLKERNLALEAEVRDLKQGHAAIEERARSELGMIKKDETFYQVVRE